MTVLDDKFGPFAQKIIEKFGKVATFTAQSRVNDDITGRPVKTQVEHTVKVSPPSKFKKKFTDGDVITEDRFSVIVSRKNLDEKASGYVPAKVDLLEIDGTKYTIEEVNPLYSGEQIAAYKLLLNR